MQWEYSSKERTVYSLRMIYASRKRERRPSSARLQVLFALVAEHAGEALIELGHQDVPTDDRVVVVMCGRLQLKEDKD